MHKESGTAEHLRLAMRRLVAHVPPLEYKHAGEYAAVHHDDAQHEQQQRAGAKPSWIKSGALCDVRDEELCWSIGVVRRRSRRSLLDAAGADGDWLVHYLGWSSKYDECMSNATLHQRTAPLHSRVTGATAFRDACNAPLHAVSQDRTELAHLKSYASNGSLCTGQWTCCDRAEHDARGCVVVDNREWLSAVASCTLAPAAECAPTSAQ
jgi:hypothetical protein